jgi:inhibitor of cysteine peptidase
MKKAFLLMMMFSASLCAQTSIYKPIHLQVNTKVPHFTITLPANPTTGYHWELTQSDQKLYTLTNQHYVKPTSQLMGAQGNTVFTFKLTGKDKPAQSNMVFTYTRSWDKSQDSKQPVTLIFVDK